MDTTRTQAAPPESRGFRRRVAALSLAFLIATLFGITGVFTSTTPIVARATPSEERVTGSLQLEAANEDVTGAVALGTPSGGFSSAPGMHPPDTSAPSVPTVSAIRVTELPAELGTPSGGFSSAPGMYPPDPAVSPANAKQP